MVLVMVEGVAAGGAVVVGLAGSSPSWWQKMAAVGWAEVSCGGRGGGEEDGLACLVALCILLG